VGRSVTSQAKKRYHSGKIPESKKATTTHKLRLKITFQGKVGSIAIQLF
jgi:hypothetical protein